MLASYNSSNIGDPLPYLVRTYDLPKKSQWVTLLAFSMLNNRVLNS